MSIFALIARSPALRLAALAMLFLGFQNAAIAPYVSLIAIEKIGLSESAFSLVLTLGAIVSVTSAVLMGVMGDRGGRRQGIAIVTALATLLGLTLMVYAPSPFALILCHAVLLPLGSSLYGQVFALARLALPETSQKAGARSNDAILGSVRAGMSVSFMAMLVIWTFAFRAGMDVMQTYLAALIASCILAALMVWTWPKGAQITWADAPSGQSFRAALAELARPLVASRLVMLGAINSCAVLYFVLIGLVFDASQTRTTADIALYFGMVAGWEVPCLIYLPRLVAYIPRPTLIAIGSTFYTLHIVLMPIWVDTPFLWLGTLIAGIGGTAFIGLPIGYYQDLLHGKPGAASSLLALQKAISDILGAAVFGIGMALGGFQTVALIGFCITAFGSFALWQADRARWLMPPPALTVKES